MRNSRHLVSWKTYGLAFAIALSPALMQMEPTCAQPGDTTLSAFEFRVFSQNHIDFDSDQRVYYVWLPSAADTADVVAYSTDAAAEVTYQYLDANEDLIDAGWFTSFNGGGQMTLDGLLPQGESVFRVYVKTPGTTFAKNYTAIIQVGCSDCDDGNACTQDACDPTLDMCVHPLKNCDDGNICTVDSCDSVLGVCEHVPTGDGAGCDEGNECTVGFCASGGCDLTLVPDGTACVSDQGACQQGSCQMACTEQGIQAAISAGGGPYTFDCSGPTTIVTTDTIVIDNDVTLDGRGHITLDGNQQHRVLWVSEGTTAELIGFTVTGGFVGEPNGGGVYNGGALTLANSTVSENTAIKGGPCYCIRSCGGNIYNYGSLTLMNATVSAGGMSAGGICNDGNMMVLSSTIHDSFLRTGSVTVMNSLIDGACLHCYWDPYDGSSCDYAPASSSGYNIESPGNTCGFDQPGDLAGVGIDELRLGPLADNGGGLMTHALLDGSVAVDRIPESECVDELGAPLTADQRGVARPQSAACDVGAFEHVDCAGSLCDDGNDCTSDHCDPASYAWCAHTVVPNSTACAFSGAAGVCIAGECHETSWGTAELIDIENAGAAHDPQLAVDPGGHVTVVWSAYSQIWFNRYTPGVGWGIADTLASGDSPSLAVDAGGNATAVWQLHDGTQFSIWAARFTPGLGWAAPEAIEGLAGNAGSARVAVDGSGNAVAVWSHSDGGLFSVWSNRYAPNVGWSVAELVEAENLSDALDPRVVVDSNGNATAVWRQFDGNQYTVWANRCTLSGGWGTAERIEALGSAYRAETALAVDVHGSVVAVWSQFDGAQENIWSNRYVPSVGWGSAERIQDEPGYASNPQVDIGPDGSAIAVWQHYDSDPASVDYIWANHYTAAMGWGGAELIGMTDFGREPDLDIHLDGRAVAVWYGFNTDIWSAGYSPSSGWNSPVLIEASSQPVSMESARVVVDANGSATAVWSQHDGSAYRIWANRSELP